MMPCLCAIRRAERRLEIMELNQKIRELEGQVLNKDRKNKSKLELETEEEVTTPSKKN